MQSFSNYNINMNLSKVILGLCLLIFMIGCTTSSPRNRGSLSDAMEIARDDSNEKREVPDTPDPWDEQEEDQDDQESHVPSETSQNYKTAEDEPLTYMIRMGGSTGGTPYFNDQRGLELVLGMDGQENLSLAFFAGLHILYTNPSHEVYQSIEKEVLLLNVGGELRYYFFPGLTVFSPYLGARAGGIYMSWSFQNPLTAGADTIYSDAVGGLSLGVTTGIDFLRLDHFRLGAQLNPEIYIFSGETSEGFNNDYFGAQGVIRVGLEGGFRF
jgi:hypothetical protein